jgi:menaquinone-dependent protoporphyrinogen oxidase
MQVLVVHASTHGGTIGLAEAVAEGVRAAGHTVDVRAAALVDDIGGYQAVIIGGSLYAWSWHAEARRFVARFADQLRNMPVYAFSSGPLDDSASRGEIPPIWTVRLLLRRIDAREHATFGGRLLANVMGRRPAGDWRDLPRARRWGEHVGAMARLPAPVPAAHPMSRSAIWALLALCLFSGITALAGGTLLALDPLGTTLRTPTSLLQHSPFASFLVPGLLLALFVGLPHLVAAAVVLRPVAWRGALAFASGVSLGIYVLTEMALLRTVHPLQVLYVGVALATALLGETLYSADRMVGRRHPQLRESTP